MSEVTSQRERSFYDRQYAPLLAAPDHAQRVNRQVLLANCERPSHPFYERRRLYRAAVERLLRLPLERMRVLDYGCGPADFGVWMATEGARVTLLDLSPKAVELGLYRAAASGVAERVDGLAADASALPELPTAGYDLVYACAALHHTMKYAGALEELARITKPGGMLVLCETWGENPVLELTRRLRARWQHEEEDQGEEIVLSRRVLRRLEPAFGGWEIETFHLTAMAKRLMRGRLDQAWARGTVRALEGFDRLVLASCPPLRWWCGEALIVATRQ